MYSLSYWEQNSFFSGIDVAIIGSGIVGLTTAIFLKAADPKLRIVILERGMLPAGASTKNAGFACFGSMTELLDDLSSRSEDEVFQLVETRWKGLLRLRSILSDEAIRFQQLGGYELFMKDGEESFNTCMQNLERFNSLLKDIIGIENVFSVKDNLRLVFNFKKTSHLIFNRAEGQIDTGHLMKNLIRKARSVGIEIFNGADVKRLEDLGEKVSIQLKNETSITAKKSIVATNGFASQLLDGLDLAPARNQVIVSEPIDDLKFRGTFHLDRGYYYFRNVDMYDGSGKQRILLGGGRNLSPEEETTPSFGLTDLIQNRLEKLLHHVIFPERPLKIEHRWSGILGVGQAKEPIVKKVSPSITVAVRLGGMGVAIGSMTGEMAAKMVLEEP